MASDTSESMEFEDFEVTEVDGALLWDLLEDLENEEEKKKKKNETTEGFVGQPPEASDHEDHVADILTDGQVSLEQHEIGISKSDLKWGDNVMVETCPSYEIAAWFADDVVGMVDFGFSVGDYLQLQNGVNYGASTNEITYSCLWEDC